MEIELTDLAAGKLITLKGSFDAGASGSVRAFFATLLLEGDKEFMIDLSGVDFIDSSGLGALVGFCKKIRSTEGELRVTGMSKPVQQIFAMTHLDEIFSPRREEQLQAPSYSQTLL